MTPTLYDALAERIDAALAEMLLHCELAPQAPPEIQLAIAELRGASAAMK